jgi:hypothetical protein
MPMDSTDKAMVKGLMLFALLCGILYYYPLRGLLERVQETKEKLTPAVLDYNKYYDPAPMAVRGMPEEDASVEPVTPGNLQERKRQYLAGIGQLKLRTKEKEDTSRMGFADWTRIPDVVSSPGVYFASTWDRIKYQLADEARRANVDLVDDTIGFGDLPGRVNMSKAEAETYLRQLFIAEAVVRLCTRAKVAQEKAERESGNKPEAFMRIIKVERGSEKPVEVGPYSRIPNPKYDKAERNPKSEKFQKYITKEWDKFIYMYPVNIRLQCDVNSFRYFLSSVRSKGQFLVIRNLKIISPFLKESLRDKSELESLIGRGNEKNVDYADEHIWVDLSAAGMDFFEPPPKTEKAVVRPSAAQKPDRKRVPLGH